MDHISGGQEGLLELELEIEMTPHFPRTRTIYFSQLKMNHARAHETFAQNESIDQECLH